LQVSLFGGFKVTENERHPRTRWKPKAYHVFIALGLVIVAFFVFLRFRLKSELEKKLGAIRAAGYPVTCIELDEWYCIPAGSQNAADSFAEAFSYYKQWVGKKRELLPIVSRAELPARTEPVPEETKTVIAEYLADNRRALERLHKAAAIKHCRYPVDCPKGLAVQFSHLPDVRAAAMLLALEAVLSTENAEPQLATDSITSAFSLARSLSNEPTVISHLACIACRSLAVQSLEHSLNRVQFTDEQLAGLDRTLAEAEDLSALARAWAGERCQGIEFFNDPVTHAKALGRDGLPLPSGPLVFLYQAAGLSDKDALVYLDYVEACIKANQVPLHQRRKAVEAAEDELGSVSKIHVLLHAFVPPLSRVTELDLTAIARLRTAHVALAVERYRLSAGRLPDRLADLVGDYLDAVPTDPFDGKDLRYKKLEAGFVVYSIGEDETDNGGKEEPARAKRRGYDITFIVER
jgi:hypothetical protein